VAAQQIARECVELACRPSAVSFAGKDAADLVVVGVRTVIGKTDRGAPEYRVTGDIPESCVAIPLKRFVAYPHDGQQLVLPSTPMRDAKGVVRVYTMGGLEHNLRMLHAGANGRKLECFCESYAATCNGVWRSRVSAPNFAEVYCLQWSDRNRKTDVYGINGFSAPMSGIAFVRLATAVVADRQTRRRFVPEPGQTVLYELPNQDSLARAEWYSEDPYLLEWDMRDLLNGPAAASEFLSRIRAHAPQYR